MRFAALVILLFFVSWIFAPITIPTIGGWMLFDRIWHGKNKWIHYWVQTAPADCDI